MIRHPLATIMHGILAMYFRICDLANARYPLGLVFFNINKIAGTYKISVSYGIGQRGNISKDLQNILYTRFYNVITGIFYMKLKKTFLWIREIK